MPVRFANATIYNGTSTIRLGDAGEHYTHSGVGIRFPTDWATTKSADVNTLDDYEEGTMPGMTLYTDGTPLGGVTYFHAAGAYVKVGRVVHCTFGVYASWSSGAGNLLIAGFPFAEGVTGGYREPGMAIANTSWNANVLRVAMLQSTTNAIIYKGGGGSQLTVADVGTAFWLHGSFTYITA